MLAILVAAAIAPTPYVLVKFEKPVIKAGEKAVFKIFIANKGRVPALVVQPNDGSDWHMRTPYTGWAVKEATDKTAWPSEPPKAKGARCGNMDGLAEKDLVDLRPGRVIELDQTWLHEKPEFKKPGKYKVVFYYWHVNKAMVLPNNTAVKDRIMASEPYCLRSSEVAITVR